MKSESENRIKNISGKVMNVSNVAMIIFIILAVLQAGLLVWVIISSKGNSTVELNSHLSLGGNNLVDGEDNIYYTGRTCGYAVSVISSCALFAVIMHFANNLFGRIYYYVRPFDKENINDMIIIAKLIILYAFAPSIIGSVATVFANICMQNSLDFNIILDVNFVAIFIALIFYCIVEIFKYGCELQQESDETI